MVGEEPDILVFELDDVQETEHMAKMMGRDMPKTFKKNAPENKCYGSNSELPDGIFSVEKCVQGVPMAVSLPHFLHADEW